MSKKGKVIVANLGNPHIEKRVIAVIHKEEIYSDVLERIDGYESYVDSDSDSSNVIYRIGVFKKILTDRDDDTNETTKYRIEQLVKRIGKADYVMIVV